jgi:hypothetical protein
MTPEMEDYARLAEEIGMTRNICNVWFDTDNSYRVASELPAYLAEPAQMSRILDWAVDRYLQVILTKMDGVLEVDIVPQSATGTRQHVGVEAESIGAGVRDAAALAVRERA